MFGFRVRGLEVWGLLSMHNRELHWGLGFRVSGFFLSYKL